MSKFDDLNRAYRGVDIGEIFIKGVTGLAVFVVIGSVLFPGINKVTDERTVEVTVTDKVVKNDDNDGKYLIYTVTDDGEPLVLEITDSLYKWRFDSSDVYATIKKDRRYRFTICGNRIHFLSMYPNIYEAQEIS